MAAEIEFVPQRSEPSGVGFVPAQKGDSGGIEISGPAGGLAFTPKAPARTLVDMEPGR